MILHGGVCAIPVWPQARDYFSKKFRVITPEQRAHGHTPDDRSKPISYHDMAEDTAVLLKDLGIEEAHVLGWSDGGVVGLDLAIHHPELVKKLVVVGTHFYPSVTEVKREFEPTADSIPAFVREAYERSSPDGVAYWPLMFARMLEMWKTQPNFTKEELGSIRAATFVVAGDKDMVSPEKTVELWRSIPDSRLWILPDGDHGLIFNRAAEFHAAVDAFLNAP